ncbi:MAG: hypothetical protein ACRBCK_04765 [Alphaproteobacteria bacterium]
MIGLFLKRLFVTAAVGTGGAAAYAHLKDDDNREEVTTAVKEVTAKVMEDPTGSFNDFADSSLELVQNADEHITNYGNSVIGAGKVVADPLGAAEQKLNDTFGLNANGENDEGGSMWKWLLGGAGGIAGFKLLSNMFGGKDNENNSSGGLGMGGTLLMVGAVIGVAMDAFGIRTKLTGMFNDLTGNDKGDTVDLAQKSSAEPGVNISNGLFQDMPEAPGF